jgi:hypothetical protein
MRSSILTAHHHHHRHHQVLIPQINHHKRVLLSSKISSTDSSSSSSSSTSSTSSEEEEEEEFEELLKKCSVRSQVKLDRRNGLRGLFATGAVGWKEPSLLLEVPIDICICSPIGESTGEGVLESNDKTAMRIVESFEKRNKRKLPKFIKKLVQAKTSERREVGLALWVLWAVENGGDVWETYKKWLPKRFDMPSLLLATDAELDICSNAFDFELKSDAAAIKKKISEMFVKYEVQYKDEDDVGLKDSITVDDLFYAFSLVRSRAIAAEVGQTPDSNVDNTRVAVLAPILDMANHASNAQVNALKKIGASDGGGMQGSLFRLVHGGSVDGGGGSVILETRRKVSQDEEITISYGPQLSNKELMRAYGFTLLANKFDRLSIGNDRDENETNKLNAKAMRLMCEECEIVFKGIDAQSLSRVDAAIRSASLDENYYDDNENENDDDETIIEIDIASELLRGEQILQLWSGQLNSILDTLSETDLEDELQSKIENADKNLQLRKSTAFEGASYRYMQSHIRFLSKAIDVLENYVLWLQQ